MKPLPLICLLLSYATSAYAEQCKLDIRDYMHGPNCSEIVKKYEPVELSSWEACFNAAATLAERAGMSGPIGIASIEKAGCLSYTGSITRSRYVTWVFLDSYIPFASSFGDVNANTRKFIHAPLKGPQAFLENGKRLERY